MKTSQAASTLCQFLGAAALAAAGTAFGAQLPKEGSYDFTACWAGSANAIAFSKTHVAVTFDMSGVSLSNPPGGMYDHHSFRCIGLSTTFSGKVKQISICEGTDLDGDKTLSHFDGDGKHGTRTLLEGTGKFAGMESTGTAESLGKFVPIKPGTFQSCNHQTGTYKMKQTQ